MCDKGALGPRRGRCPAGWTPPVPRDEVLRLASQTSFDKLRGGWLRSAPPILLGHKPRRAPVTQSNPSHLAVRKKRPHQILPSHTKSPRQRAPGLALVAGLLCTFATLPGGCASGPDLSADYGQTARENYELAVGEFADKDWEEVVAYADFVRIRFPFSRYSVESELLICRAQFELGEFIIAQDAFKQFARLHPTHQHVRNGWVPYMAAVSAYMAAPENGIIVPPHYQRDQSLLQDALLELAYFFDHYGHTQMNSLAKDLQAKIQRKLLEHELYVAEFYLDRERPEAAIGRLESAHATYPGIGLDANVLFLLGITYLRVDEIELARNTFSELSTQHPSHFHGPQAKLYLRHIQEVYGPEDQNRIRPERPRPKPLPPARPKKPDSKTASPASTTAKNPSPAPANSAPTNSATATSTLSPSAPATSTPATSTPTPSAPTTSTP